MNQLHSTKNIISHTNHSTRFSSMFTNKTYEKLHLIPNADGTFTRPSEFFPTVPPSTTNPSSPSLSKDVPLNSEKNTWVRVFISRKTIASDKKLPIIVYVHGGGFVLASPDYPVFHEFCSTAATQLGALVITVKYRLAPERRLPAAYEDVLETLKWIAHSEDEWIKKYGDISNCVIMGESAGGNISYHAGLMAAAKVNDFKPLIIKGLVLIQPFFGGLERSKSEIRLVDDPMLPLEMNDFCWHLSLPVGADRNHEYCDATVNGGSSLIDKVRDLRWWVGVVACYGDPLFDRDVELAKLLEMKGVIVKTLFSEGGRHGMFVGDLPMRIELLEFVKSFWP